MTGITNILLRLWQSFMTLIFPNVCEVCGQTLVSGEKVICTNCQINLPRLAKSVPGGMNSVERKCFIADCCVAGTALYRYFRHDRYAILIRKFKYFGRRDIASDLGGILAEERKNDGFFNSIDYLIPVPMSFIKKIKRGYNQSHEICRGISRVTGIPIADNLYAMKGHGTQTHKNAEERRKNIEGIYSVRRPSELEYKHIGLVDDVVTTGATMQQCAKVLHDSIPGIRISFITIGTTELQ